MSAGSSAPHVLRDYALLADGERGVLVGPRGDLAWMCFPRWDGDALFASLIGGGGCYAVEPSERYVWGGYYEEGTLIWRSRWVTTSAVIECREALALPSSRGRAVVLRRVVARSGARAGPGPPRGGVRPRPRGGGRRPTPPRGGPGPARAPSGRRPGAAPRRGRGCSAARGPRGTR